MSDIDCAIVILEIVGRVGEDYLDVPTSVFFSTGFPAERIIYKMLSVHVSEITLIFGAGQNLPDEKYKTRHITWLKLPISVKVRIFHCLSCIIYVSKIVI